MSGNGQTGFARSSVTADAAAPPPGQTFQLTTGADDGSAFTGTDGDDTFVGLTSDSAADTLTSGDTLDGRGGRDTLDMTVNSKRLDLGEVNLSRIEALHIASTAPRTEEIALADAGDMFESVTLDLTGIEQEFVSRVAAINPATELTLTNGDGNGELFGVDYVDTAAAGGSAVDITMNVSDIDDMAVLFNIDGNQDGSATNDSVTLNLGGLANSDGEMLFNLVGGIENWTVNVDAASTMNSLRLDSPSSTINNQTVDLNIDADLTIEERLQSREGLTGDQIVNIRANADLAVNKTRLHQPEPGESLTVNITGRGDVTLDDLGSGGAVGSKTIDASGAQGDVVLRNAAEGFDTIQTGSGDDTVRTFGAADPGVTTVLTTRLGGGADKIDHFTGQGALRSVVQDFDFGTDTLGLLDDSFDAGGVSNASEMAAFVNDAAGTQSASAADITVLKSGASTPTGGISAVFEYNGSTHVVGSQDQAFNDGDVFITLTGVTAAQDDGSDIGVLFDSA